MKKWICRLAAALIILPVLATTTFASGHGHGHGHGHGSSGHSQKHSNSVCVTKEVGTAKATAPEISECSDNQTCFDKCSYTDENNDNRCDNCDNVCAECGKVTDEDCDGICDNCGKCSHYQDGDKDGVCDHQKACADRKKAERPLNTSSKKHHCTRPHRNHH